KQVSEIATSAAARVVDAPVKAEAATELISLFEFLASAGQQLSLSDLLCNIERRIGRLVPFTTMAIYLENGDQALKAAHVAGKGCDRLIGFTIRLARGISGWVAAYQRPLINTGAALEFQELGCDFTWLTDSLVVPMVVDGISVGTIALYGQA